LTATTYLRNLEVNAAVYALKAVYSYLQSTQVESEIKYEPTPVPEKKIVAVQARLSRVRSQSQLSQFEARLLKPYQTPNNPAWALWEIVDKDSRPDVTKDVMKEYLRRLGIPVSGPAGALEEDEESMEDSEQPGMS